MAAQRFDMKQTADPGACAEALLDMIDALLKFFCFFFPRWEGLMGSSDP